MCELVSAKTDSVGGSLLFWLAVASVAALAGKLEGAEVEYVGRLPRAPAFVGSFVTAATLFGKLIGSAAVDARIPAAAMVFVGR